MKFAILDSCVQSFAEVENPNLLKVKLLIQHDGANKNGTKWRFRFIDSTHFDREDRSTKARENMAYGGSRFEFLACQGYDPLEGINLLKAEQLLGMDDIMIPQATSHTLSKDNKAGRPKTETDKGSGVSTEAEEE